MTSVDYPAAYVQKVNYVYLLQKSGYVTSNTPIYKVGHTKQELLGRFQQYERGAKLILQIECVDSVECEKQILAEFKTTFAQATKDGNESFQGDYKQMIRIIYRIAMEQLDPDRKATNDDTGSSDTAAPYYVSLEECFKNYTADAPTDILAEAEQKCTNMLKDAYYEIVKVSVSWDQQTIANSFISMLFPDFKQDKAFGGNKKYFIILPSENSTWKTGPQYKLISIDIDASNVRELQINDMGGFYVSGYLSGELVYTEGAFLFDVLDIGSKYKPSDILMGGMLKLGVVYDINDVKLQNDILSSKKNIEIHLIETLVKNIDNCFVPGQYAGSCDLYRSVKCFIEKGGSFKILLSDYLVNETYIGIPDTDIKSIVECQRFDIDIEPTKAIEIVKIGNYFIPSALIDYCFPTRVYCTNVEYVMYNRYQRPICEYNMKRKYFLPGATCHYLTDIDIDDLDRNTFSQIKKKFLKLTKSLTCINPNPITDRLLKIFD